MDAAPAARSGSPLTIVECDDTWQTRWDAYTDGCPHASLYHLWAWQDVNRTVFGHRTTALAALDGDRIRGIFPIVHVRSALFGRLGCSMPFVNFGGPASDTPEVDAALLTEGAALVARERLDYLEVRSTRQLGEQYLTQTHKISMTVDLPTDPEVMWTKFKSAHRQDIRKAANAGFVAKHGGRELLADFYAILSESWRDLGTPFYSRRYFERLFDALGDRLWITVVYHAEEPAGAQLSGTFQETAEGMWLGMREKFRRMYAGYVLYWEILKYASQRGQRKYHLGRSTADSGAEAFKKKWNAYPTQLYWHYLASEGRPLPQLRVDNPKYRLAIDTWRKLPLSVTQLVGPYLARGIP
jgi:FemAB-related protein (PEP-CTERM system-associated)